MTKEIKKIKAFFIDAEKHELTVDETNEILNLCEGYGVVMSERHSVYVKGLIKYPCFGLYNDDESYTFVQTRSWCEIDSVYDFTEISPDDVDTWLKHGQTLEEYNSWKEVAESLKAQVDSSAIAFPDKPTLGLLPHKQWIILRQYDIVRALARQADNNELLNEDWVSELVDLMGEE